MTDSEDYLHYTSQLVFHFTNGEKETYYAAESDSFADTQSSDRPNIQRRLAHPWCILHTPNETVFINMANVLRVEVKPTVTEIQGEEVFPAAERVTPLTNKSRLS